MNKRNGGPLARGTAAPKTRHRQEADPNPDCTGPGRLAGRIHTGHGQYALTFDDALTSAQRFEIFHRENPHVYRLLVDLTREWKIATDGQKLGIRCLWEQLRWRVAVKTIAADYRLNDHYPPYYARLIEYQEPDLRGVFERRRSPEADAWIARVTA